eukprot:188685-Amphidinium_carterae.1
MDRRDVKRGENFLAEAVASRFRALDSDEESELSLSEFVGASPSCRGGTRTQGAIFGGPQITYPGGLAADRGTSFASCFPANCENAASGFSMDREVGFDFEQAEWQFYLDLAKREAEGVVKNEALDFSTDREVDFDFDA